LAEELLKGADGEKVIAVVSAPSVFIELKNILVCSLDFFFSLCFSSDLMRYVRERWMIS